MMRRAWVLGVMVLLLLAAGLRAAPLPLVPDDPYYASHTWYGPVLSLPTAWGYGQGSSSVIAAVLDTGVMASTPDLAGRLLPPLSANAAPPLDGTIQHHGTWVASVMAMQVNNGMGGAGVGNFNILPISVTYPDGNNLSDWLATGIRMAADRGAKVINISHSTAKYGPLNEAAAYARSKGALTFMAAGNSNQRKLMSGYDNLIFVAGTNRNDERWEETSTTGSTYGPYVDLSAPADDILVADPTLSTGYGIISGTSFAAPLAAGAAALAWSINPALTPDQVESILYNTATDLGTPGWDEMFGHGRLDIGAVAAAAHATVPEPATGGLILALAVVLCRRRPPADNPDPSRERERVSSGLRASASV